MADEASITRWIVTGLLLFGVFYQVMALHLGRLPQVLWKDVERARHPKWFWGLYTFNCIAIFLLAISAIQLWLGP